MAEEKPKGEPVFLKIPTTGETITLPGVTSLSSNDELKAAADAWIAKNYKGPLLAAPVVARTPAEGESVVTANRQPELTAVTPTTITGGVYDALASGVANVAGLLPGFDERGAVQYGQDVVQNIESLLGLQAIEQSIGDILVGRGTGTDYLTAGLTALPLAPLAARPIAAGVRRVAPETSAAIGRFATGPAAVADEIAAAVPETALTPEMAAVAAPVAPAPVVPSKLPKAQAVETTAPVTTPAFQNEIPTPLMEVNPTRATVLRNGENYRTNLKDWTPKLYRETSPEDLELFLPTGGVDKELKDTNLFFADTPDLALGQGQNKGILMEFDASGLSGKLNKSKPAWRLGVEEASGSEFIANLNTTGKYRQNLSAVRVAKDATLDKMTQARLPRALDKLEQNGWVKTETDQYTQYTRPQAAALPEAPVAAAAIPEAAVAPTPTPEIAPAITPERLAEMRTSAEDVLKGMATGTPEAPIPERIGTMKATNFETPDETKRFLADIADANKNFPEARRGTMTIGQINDLSKDINLETILGRKVGMPLNAEQIQAAKNVLYQNTDDVVAKAKAWVASGGRDAALLQEATDGLVTNTAFLETLQGASSELGRAMRVLRERPSVDMTLAMKQLLERKADGVPIEDIMQRLATFDDPAKAAEFVSKINTPGFKDKIEEVFVNSLLSGTFTHIYNLASNLGVALTTPFEKFAEAGIGAVLRTPNRVTVREVNARVAGMLQGAKDGVELAKRAFVTEEVQTGKQIVEANRKAIGGRLGRVVRLPNRFLSAQDELFKSMHYRGEIAAQAYLRASKESAKKTDEFAELYNKYLNDPTDDIKKAAVREAEYRTFQSELGRFGKWVQKGSSDFLALRILQPFVRSPFNLIKYSAERGPLAPLSDRWRRQLMGTPRQRNEALAQLTLGSSVLGTASILAMNGKMTGAGPSDPDERAALLATGWQPYSFVDGDTYIPFQRFEPFSTSLGVIADMFTASDYMTDKEINDVGATLLFSVAANLAEKTYLQGISNFVDSVVSEGRSVDKAKKFLTDTALGFVPNILRQTSVAIDPTMREATTLVKKVQDRIPYVRGNDIRVMGTDINLEAVPERLDVWGDPIVRAPSMTVAGKPLVDQFGAAAYNLLVPIKPTRETTDPVKKEVARLGLGLERPKKEVNLSINIEGREKPVKFKIELTDRERRQFTLVSGIVAKKIIEQDIASPEWQRLDDDQRQKLIRDRMSSSRDAFRQLIASRALKRYLAENDDLPPIVK